jgi:hypothetical protein
MTYVTEHALIPLAWAEYLAYGDAIKLTDDERLRADAESYLLGDLVSFSRFPGGTRKDPPLAQCTFVRPREAA